MCVCVCVYVCTAGDTGPASTGCTEAYSGSGAITGTDLGGKHYKFNKAMTR